MDSSNLVRFRTVREVTGLAPYKLTRRLQRTGIDYFVDGNDRRQRSIDVKDLPRLIAPEPVKRRGDSPA
jgi:glycerol-3-phosphate cytidylyltransferase-like family protein